MINVMLLESTLRVKAHEASRFVLRIRSFDPAGLRMAMMSCCSKSTLRVNKVKHLSEL